jgi:hypothetical protein
MVVLALSLSVAAGLIVVGCSADRQTATGGTEPTPSDLEVLEKAVAGYVEQSSRQSCWKVLEREIEKNSFKNCRAKRRRKRRIYYASFSAKSGEVHRTLPVSKAK